MMRSNVAVVKKATLLILLLSSYVPIIGAQCLVGCVDGTLGFQTIQDLNCAIQQEALAVRDQQINNNNNINSNINLRGPPYVYRLCDNTVLTANLSSSSSGVDAASATTTIRPLLNQTEIYCQRPGTCIIETTSSNDDGLASLSLLELTQPGIHVTLRGIVFRGPASSAAAAAGTTASATATTRQQQQQRRPLIVASAPYTSRLLLDNCHWQRQHGTTLIIDNSLETISSSSNVFNLLPLILPSASLSPREEDTGTDGLASTLLMKVVLQDCTFTNTDNPALVGTATNPKQEFAFTQVIRSYNGTVIMKNVTIQNYNVSRFMDMRDNAQVSVSRSRFQRVSTLKDPQSFHDVFFVDAGASLFFNQIQATGNVFSNFVWQQQESTVVVQSSDFYDNDDNNPDDAVIDDENQNDNDSNAISETNSTVLVNNTSQAPSTMAEEAEAVATPPAPSIGAIFRITNTATSLEIRDCFFKGRGFSHITASGQGPRLDIQDSVFVAEQRCNHAVFSFTQTTIRNSCFEGITLYPPIFVTGGSNNVVNFENVHSSTDVITTSECNGLFVEDEGDECFYPKSNQGGVCVGQCVALDAPVCNQGGRNRDPPPVYCDNLQCPDFPSIALCQPTLYDLRCTMCLEAESVASGAVLRPPPYLYVLCPDRTYSITNETQETIFPILNNTIIQCGNNGRSNNNCIIRGGLLQMEIGQSFRQLPPQQDEQQSQGNGDSDTNNENALNIFTLLSREQERMEYIQVRGLTFVDGRNDARRFFSPSIWGRASSRVEANFIDCHWLGRNAAGADGITSTSSNFILNFNRDEDTREALPGMTMTFDQCSMRGISKTSGDTVPIRSHRARIEMSRMQIQDVQVAGSFGEFFDSVFTIRDSSIEENIVGSVQQPNTFFLFTEGSRGLISNVRVIRNTFQEMNLVSGRDTRLLVEFSTVSENNGTTLFDCQNSQSVTVESSTFQDFTMSSMILSKSCQINVDRTLFSSIQSGIGISATDDSMVRISDSCFLNGTYTFPMYFSGPPQENRLIVQNVFGGNTLRTNCRGVLVEDDGNTRCLDSLEVCLATCNDFDANECAITSTRTTPRPIVMTLSPTTSQPSMANVSSSAPSRAPLPLSTDPPNAPPPPMPVPVPPRTPSAATGEFVVLSSISWACLLTVWTSAWWMGGITELFY